MLGAPEGYHPSVKYCRISSSPPATMGVAMLVPRMESRLHVNEFACLHACSAACYYVMDDCSVEICMLVTRHDSGF